MKLIWNKFVSLVLRFFLPLIFNLDILDILYSSLLLCYCTCRTYFEQTSVCRFFFSLLEDNHNQPTVAIFLSSLIVFQNSKPPRCSVMGIYAASNKPSQPKSSLGKNETLAFGASVLSCKHIKIELHLQALKMHFLLAICHSLGSLYNKMNLIYSKISFNN